MTFKNKSFLLGISFTAFAHLLTAQTYCLKYDMSKQGNYIDVKISMVATRMPFHLGASNLQFKYSKAALTNPIILHNTLTNNRLYENITLTQPHPPTFAKTNHGLISYNFEYKGVITQGLSIEASEKGTEIAVIRFDIKDATLIPNFQTYDNGSKGTIVYNDDTHNPLLIQPTPNCPNYNAFHSEKEPTLKGYPNLMQVSNAHFTLEVPDFENEHRQTYQIRTILGKQVLSGKTAAQMEINVSHLVAGTYFVKVGSEQLKFVIQ